MSGIASYFRTLKIMMSHPLGCRDRKATLLRFLRWQIGSRMLGMSVAAPFVNGTRLLVRTGMHGATMNLYVGLHEFEDMAFVLHLLQPGDAFLDVGSNVGVYSIMAASLGARVLAFEPVPSTYETLRDNIWLNRFIEQIDALNVGVGGEAGMLRFSSDSGPTNHVLAPNETALSSVTIPVEKLDILASELKPVMLKIDVEGFESEVLRGAELLLSRPELQAVLLELNGMGTRYGFEDAAIHQKMLDFGFSPTRYYPFERRLEMLNDHGRTGNTLYLRPSSDLKARLQNAKPVMLGNINV